MSGKVWNKMMKDRYRFLMFRPWADSNDSIPGIATDRVVMVVSDRSEPLETRMFRIDFTGPDLQEVKHFRRVSFRGALIMPLGHERAELRRTFEANRKALPGAMAYWMAMA